MLGVRWGQRQAWTTPPSEIKAAAQHTGDLERRTLLSLHHGIPQSRESCCQNAVIPHSAVQDTLFRRFGARNCARH